MISLKIPALFVVAALMSANTLHAQESLVHPVHDSVAQAASRIAREPSKQPGERHQRGWASRHPVLLGALVGLGLGLVADAKTCRASSDYTCRRLGVYLGGVGAGVGAGVGGLVALATQ
ncbi:MAG TPA: hypothetical protein VGG73_03060 [Vicinamibacterales bacterium]|jgi:hypothetical protein